MRKSDILWARRGIAGLCLLMPQLVWSESRVMRRLMSVRQTTARPVWSIWCLCWLVRLSSNWKSQRPSVVSRQPGGGLLISQVYTCSLAVNDGLWISVGANYVTCKPKICLYALLACVCVHGRRANPYAEVQSGVQLLASAWRRARVENRRRHWDHSRGKTDHILLDSLWRFSLQNTRTDVFLAPLSYVLIWDMEVKQLGAVVPNQVFLMDWIVVKINDSSSSWGPPEPPQEPLRVPGCHSATMTHFVHQRALTTLCIGQTS